MAIKSGRAIPPRMLEPPPEVALGLGLYMRAFFELASERRNGGGRIPWSAIQAWCDAKDLVGLDAEDVHFLVNRMDIVYIDWAAKKAKTMRVNERAREEQSSGVTRGIQPPNGRARG